VAVGCASNRAHSRDDHHRREASPDTQHYDPPNGWSAPFASDPPPSGVHRRHFSAQYGVANANVNMTADVWVRQRHKRPRQDRVVTGQDLWQAPPSRLMSAWIFHTVSARTGARGGARRSG